MNFVAMDFETASRKRASACSIALTLVENDQVTSKFYSLINPETSFDWQNIKVHGIHEADVLDAPTFPMIWDHIQDLFASQQLIVAHNISFDNSVLKKSLERYAIPLVKYPTLDTVKTSRNFYPQFENYKLNTVCDQLNITLENHHNALDDSVACANILIAQEQQFGHAAISPFIKMQN